MRTTSFRFIAGLLIVAVFVTAAASPVFAQPRPGGRPGGPPPGGRPGDFRPSGPPPGGRPGGPPPPRPSWGPVAPPPRPWGPPPPPPPPRYHHHNDLGTALAVMGAVGVTAAVVNGMSRYNYNRYNPPVIYTQAPSTVVVEKQTVVERPVVVDSSDGTYSTKMGASFRIEKMQIPGYKFTAARLLSNPVEGSPLEKLGLRQGDVITRLDDSPADNLAELDRHVKNTLIRYIKTGTTKVNLGTIYIPTDSEALSAADEYSAP